MVALQGCKNNDFAYEVGELSLTPTKEKRYVEGFPIWKFIDYADGQLPIQYATSLDVTFPEVFVLQQGIEYGQISAAEENLPYQADNEFAFLNAEDIARGETSYWIVRGDDTLYKKPLSNDSSFYHHNQWQLNQAKFTEVAVEADTNIVWLLDSNKNRLYRFNPENENLWPYYSLPASLAITDIALLDNTITLTYQADDEFYMTRFTMGDPRTIEASNSNQLNLVFESVELSEDSAWYISGFDGKTLTDASYIPDGRLMVSFDSPTENLYLIVDEDANIGDGPIEVTGDLELINESPLPNAIRQPSGLSPRSDGTWYMVTDQAEVFILSADFSQVIHSGQLNFNTIGCNQGCTEGITTIDDDNFYVITDAGVVAKFSLASQGFTNLEEYSLPLEDSLSFSGMTLDQTTNHTYLVNDSANAEETDSLFTLDSSSQFNLVESYTISREGVEDIWSYDAQGVYYHEDKIYVVSERFTQLLQINMQGEIEHVYEFSHEDIASPSDLSIQDDKIYIIGDHEDDQPVPPVRVYQLP